MSKEYKNLLLIVILLFIGLFVALSYGLEMSFRAERIEESVECQKQQFHCSQSELFSYINSFEKETIGKKGLYQWYYHHDAGSKKASNKQKQLNLTVASNGAAHWE
jgi:hypothetical protein